ncbi:MAG: L,D-transpeptidase family protein [Desulfurivibrionaceae bacterium]|nr:L,D-transpeptidase family protein [Desulfurivibrionaceae bacterium]
MTLSYRCCVLFMLLAVALAAFPAAVPGAAPVAEPDKVQDALGRLIATELADEHSVCRGRSICAASTLPVFYERRGFAPAWSRDGTLQEHVTDFVVALAAMESQGLRPADYHLYTIRMLLVKYEQVRAKGTSLALQDLVDLDLLLTDAFFLYGSHLLAGRINPETIDERWSAGEYGTDLAAILEEALVAPAGVTGALPGLRPPHTAYRRLMEALAAMRTLVDQGGWPVVGDGTYLHKGIRHRRVYALRQRLMISGDYEERDARPGNFFDDKLNGALRRFQARHGLIVDGIIGPKTLAALNVPAESRLRQIKANLERWRWAPRDLGRRYILVNIADFTLRLVEDGRQVLQSRVVVGSPHRSTPVFSDQVEYLVFNPYWHLPESIIVEDVAPKVIADPDYLARKGIKVFAKGSAEEQQVSPAAIEWQALRPGNVPYRLRQEPGPANALGRVKVLFPNKFSIYLHDTPRQELFQKNARGFSSGCIRVEDVVGLASYLLQDDPRWNRQRVMAAMEDGRRQYVALAEQVPIHILYQTAWADGDGTLHFRGDIYGRDERLAAALDGRAVLPAR